MKDPQKLGECYLKLIEVRSDLLEIMERNSKVEPVVFTIKSALKVLDVVSHSIHRAGHILKEAE